MKPSKSDDEIKTQRVVIERVFLARSEDGTFEDARKSLVLRLGEFIAGYLMTNLYEQVTYEFPMKRCWVDSETQKAYVQWRVIIYLFTYSDGVVHLEGKVEA